MILTFSLNFLPSFLSISVTVISGLGFICSYFSTFIEGFQKNCKFGEELSNFEIYGFLCRVAERIGIEKRFKTFKLLEP